MDMASIIRLCLGGAAAFCAGMTIYFVVLNEKTFAEGDIRRATIVGIDRVKEVDFGNDPPATRYQVFVTCEIPPASDEEQFSTVLYWDLVSHPDNANALVGLEPLVASGDGRHWVFLGSEIGAGTVWLVFAGALLMLSICPVQGDTPRSLTLRSSWTSVSIGAAAVLWFASSAVYDNGIVAHHNLASLRACHIINAGTAILAGCVLVSLINELRKWWMFFRSE